MSAHNFQIGTRLDDESKAVVDITRLVDTRLLVQANSGGGKSWLLRRLAEYTCGKVQTIILDPEGEFVTLREVVDVLIVGKDGELPPTWGLMAPAGSGLAVVVKAPKLKPIAMDRMFIAALLRRAHESDVDSYTLAQARIAGQMEERAKESAVVTKQTETIVKLTKRIQDFEAASGIDIDGYTGPKELGDAVRLIANGNHMRQLAGQVYRMRRELLESAARMRRTMRAIEAMEQAK